MNHLMIDRRQMRRHQHVEEHGIVSARVKPGHRAKLIDVSTGGALIETHHRLLPGTSVELHMETETRRASVRSRVLRCAIVRVRSTSVCYQGALGFDQHLPWFVDDPGHRVTSAEARPADPVWEDATPEVL